MIGRGKLTPARMFRALGTRGAPRGFANVSRMFYCVGAQKAGTTWLHKQLRASPSVHLPPVKEVHYWDTIYPPNLPYYREQAARELARLEDQSVLRRMRRHLDGSLRRARLYQAMFEEKDERHSAYQQFVTLGWSGQPVVADISPGYAMMERAGFAEMNRASPDARFVFIMRDPVARLWSNLRHNRSRGFLSPELRGDLSAAFAAVLADPDSGPTVRSDYARTIRELEAAIPPEQIAYFFYETLFTQDEIARLSAFLGIGPIPADLDQRVNAARDGENRPDPVSLQRGREAFAPVYEFVNDRFPDRVPAAWLAEA